MAARFADADGSELIGYTDRAIEIVDSCLTELEHEFAEAIS